MNTAAVPQIEFHVQTECGRNFCWSASDLDHLFRDLTYKGYRATRVMLQSEYEAEQSMKNQSKEVKAA